MEEIEIPCHFLCPISLQLMRDPVTISTGITYDRESIEKWLFSCKNTICPVTKQALISTDLTPNHTLRRLIQSWCTLHASNGVERIPTPKPPVEKHQISKLLNDAAKSSQMQHKCLQRLRSIASNGQSNRRCLEAAGTVRFLSSIIAKSTGLDHGRWILVDDEDQVIPREKEEALTILHQLEPSENELKTFMKEHYSGDLTASLLHILRHGHAQLRAYAIRLLKSIYNVAHPTQLASASIDLFIQIVNLLKDQVSRQASKDALKLLIEINPWGRNRIKAVESGTVMTLIDLLLDEKDRRVCELMLMVLDQLCGCAEGRADLVAHGAGLAVVGKKILRVSHGASERGVRIVALISRYTATGKVLGEMMEVGVVAKLCLVLQVDCSVKAKERAKEVLKLHSRVWKNSPCIPPHLVSSYPSK